jgi:hypothetical protein
LRSWHFLSWSRNSQHFMEPKVSLLCLQDPATCPHPKPHLSSPWPPQTTS